MDANELVWPIERGWPLDGIAADWVMDLEAGRFGELQLRMGYDAVVQLFSYNERGSSKIPRGPAAIRLCLGFEEDEEIPEDDDEEMEFVTDIELDWSELLDSGTTASHRPLIQLPGRKAIPCTSLTLLGLEEVFGQPTLAEIFDDREDQWLIEWRLAGFFVTGFTERGSLIKAGISSVGLDGDPPLRLVV